MSIIQRRDINVFPMTAVRDRYNAWEMRRSPEPVLVEDVTIEDETDRTRDPDESYLGSDKVIRGRGIWPGGVKSIVEIDGEEFDQVGKVRVRATGYFTKHFEVRVSSRGAKVK